MKYDIMLFSLPNKNMDYPGLALPTLTAHLREKKYRTFQEDSNVIIRDKMMTEGFLNDLTHTILPNIYYQNLNDTKISKRIKQIIDFYIKIEQIHGFDEIEKIKKDMQSRKYAELLSEEKSFEIVSILFKISRSFHNIIDIIPNYSSLFEDFSIYNPIEEYLKKILDNIKKSNPFAVGFTVLNIQRKFTINFAERLSNDFSGYIFVGGPDPTKFGKQYIESYPFLDVAFIKESEENLLQIMEIIKNDGDDFSNIPAIVYKNNNTIKENKIKPINFENLLTPDFDGISLDKYLTNVLPIQASRGCFYGKCKFCIHWKTYFKYYQKKPENVAKDLEILSNKYNTKFFHFTDDALEFELGNKICQEITEKKLDVRWLTYARFESKFSKDSLELWKKAGVSVIEWGLESASDKVLNRMQKGINPRIAERIIKDSSEVGITNKLFLFHDYPDETSSDLSKTIDFIDDNIRHGRIRFFMPIRNKFELLKDSQLYEESLKDYRNLFKKIWFPSGIFAIRAEYFDLNDYTKKKEMLDIFLRNMTRYMEEKNIYTTDDENITLDIICNYLSEQKIPIPFNQN
ncbi:Anaerobic magnesium-protoporphyrin IX monomethyl ester cyclase [Methanosarcinales archaeon]|nr:Anaerobic magnesium-protoporphyrin IX monomethyl ester cyclase [Methanosarcinales archaeon]